MISFECNKKAFSATDSIFHPIKNRRFTEITELSGDIFLLGDFTKNGVENCRHYWLLLQRALQESGIETAPLTCKIKVNYKEDQAELLPMIPHIAALAKLNDRAYLPDSRIQKLVFSDLGIPVSSPQELLKIGQVLNRRIDASDFWMITALSIRAETVLTHL